MIPKNPNDECFLIHRPHSKQFAVNPILYRMLRFLTSIYGAMIALSRQEMVAPQLVPTNIEVKADKKGHYLKKVGSCYPCFCILAEIGNRYGRWLSYGSQLCIFPHRESCTVSYHIIMAVAMPGDSSEKFHVPIIDLSQSYVSSTGRQQVAEEIRHACLSSGFFYITSHGIPASTCDLVLQRAIDFFKHTPPADKQRIHIKHSNHGYGWEPSTATSIAGDIERKEAFNWCYSDDLDPTGGDGRYVQLDGTQTKNLNQWPSEHIAPGFYDAIKVYYGKALLLSRHLCRLFALSLGLPEIYFDSKTTHPSANSRMLFYPASDVDVESDEVGLGAHTDYQCFTVLLCSSKPGLEIMSPSGDWVQAPTVPGGLVVNIGDMMMHWTNGLYRSTMHRVVNRTGEERYSVPLFFGINNDEMVEVRCTMFMACSSELIEPQTIPTCITGQNPAKYPPVRAGEYILRRLDATRQPSTLVRT